MASIYKLVAERRDRNQSMRRKRKERNMFMFKDSIEEVEFRRPALQRNFTQRQRTVSDQPPFQGLQLPVPPLPARRPTYDPLLLNVKNQIKNVDTKVDALTKKVDDLSKCIKILHTELNKKQSEAHQ